MIIGGNKKMLEGYEKDLEREIKFLNITGKIRKGITYAMIVPCLSFTVLSTYRFIEGDYKIALAEAGMSLLGGYVIYNGYKKGKEQREILKKKQNQHEDIVVKEKNNQ